MLEEGNLPHPRFPRCDMQVPRKVLNGRHMRTAHCAKGSERKRRRLDETKTRDNLERAFHAYRKPMEDVSEFRYLGRLMTATDNNWPAVAGNIKKGAGELGTFGLGTWQGGGGPESVTEFLHCHDTAGPPLWGEDVSSYEEDGVGPGRLSGQGCKKVNGETALIW